MENNTSSRNDNIVKNNIRIDNIPILKLGGSDTIKLAPSLHKDYNAPKIEDVFYNELKILYRVL